MMQHLKEKYNGTPAQERLDYFYQMLKSVSKDDFEELERQL